MSRFKILLSYARGLNAPGVHEAPIRLLLRFPSSHNRFCSKVIATNKDQVGPNRVPDSVSTVPVSTDKAGHDLSDYGSILLPTFNLAAYADKSPTLQKLITLGVHLHKFDEKPEIGELLVSLDFEKDIKPYLTLLHDNGLPAENFGDFITKHPLIFKESLSDIEVRINYLKSKKFDKTMITQIMTKNPSWLSVPVKTIDERLGYLQHTFSLSGDQLRLLVTKSPSLGTFPKKLLIKSIFTLKEEIGLETHELKKLVLTVPSLLKNPTYNTIGTYDYLTTTMNVSRDLILDQPHVLTCRKFILMERHKYLVSLGRAQYNPLLPGYVSLNSLIKTDDTEFCEKIAKTSVHTYDEFLKTL